MRLKKSELAPAVTGELTVEFSDGRGMSFKRPTKMAYHRKPSSTSTSLLVNALQPLFDVEVITVDTAITLKGVELRVDPETKRVYEHVQFWRCVPLAGSLPLNVP